MRFKILLLLTLMLISSGIIRAQERAEAYRNLIFSEVRMDAGHHGYAEITNMGDEDVNLAEFELGAITPWDDPYVPLANNFIRFPEVTLAHGESYVVAKVMDWNAKMAIIDPVIYGPTTKKAMWQLADLQLHQPEAPSGHAVYDSVTDPGAGALEAWNGRSCWYLRHHFINSETGQKDSTVIDAVNGIFTGEDGRRPHDGPSDVAGVTDATHSSVLIRKFSVTTGTTDWEQAQGVDITDSEWLPIPIRNGEFEPQRIPYWTVGNHGNYELNDQTVRSNTIDINWDDKTMTIDWGARNGDSIMAELEFQPGLAWDYAQNNVKADSGYVSVRTGDKFTLYALGNTLDSTTFTIIALPPTSSEARVIPANHKNGVMWYGGYTPYEVTDGFDPDTIKEVGYGTRIDTMLNYLEKAPNASWEIVFVDDTERPELITGDILKVTAEDGTTVKNYYIEVEDYVPNRDATISSITWPDIPDYLKGIWGWTGDTIPEFASTKYNYKVQFPMETVGIPSLVAKPSNPNATIEIERAKAIEGKPADRTIKFNVTAENGIATNTYNVTIEKEKDPSKVQPYYGEPFFSQIVIRESWNNFYIEVCNPGNQPLDMSRYLLLREGVPPSEAVTTRTTVDDWSQRFRRYVPGYVWEDEASWQVQPGYLVPDPTVNTIVEGGDVFVIAQLGDANHFALDEIDVNFHNDYNPWSIEFVGSNENSHQEIFPYGWTNESFYLYKILNDSVLDGSKPLIDPNDVEIIDVFGRGNWEDVGTVDGVATGQNSGYMRYPEYYKGNPVPGGSFGDGETGSEWLYTDQDYWTKLDYGYPDHWTMNAAGIGSHELTNITEFISTVSSTSFIVSEGYSLEESIEYIPIGMTVTDFLDNIITADDDQLLTVTRDGTELSGDDVIEEGDKLEVISANRLFLEPEDINYNETHYILYPSDQTLDNNALLFSDVYDIEANSEEGTGTISGIEAGTTLREIYENVDAPGNAYRFAVFFEDGFYAPLSIVNLDTAYVDVIATNDIYFEVVAQDQISSIIYQLNPETSSSDAYVLSYSYLVDQDTPEISLIPDNSSVETFYSNLIPADGATMVLKNKMGQERIDGNLYTDDELWVTAADGETQKVYSIYLLNEYRAKFEAFLYSDYYTVNHQRKQIRDNIPFGISYEDFVANIYYSFGATMQIADKDGNPKSAGSTIATGDKVTITSENGEISRAYSVTTLKEEVSVKSNMMPNMKVYPNPTKGNITIEGAGKDYTVNVYNSMGIRVASHKAISDYETISISNQPNGMYFVIVNNASQQVAKFKLIKR